MELKLTITISDDAKSKMKALFSQAIKSDEYQGEYLDFASPALFFSKLSDKRWKIINALQGAGEVPVRELARRIGRDVKRVHEDAVALVELGLINRTERGGLICKYADIHVDMHLRSAA